MSLAFSKLFSQCCSRRYKDDVTDAFVIPHELCAMCRHVADAFRAHIDDQYNEAQENLEHYSTVSSLNESARQGCHLCSIFSMLVDVQYGSGHVRANSQLEGAEMDGAVRIKMKSHNPQAAGNCTSFSIQVLLEGNSIKGSRHTTTVHQHSKDPPRWASFVCRSSFGKETEWPEETTYRWSRSTGSHAALKLLDKHLKRCLAEHRSCALDNRMGFRPTRLLDLNCFGDGDSMDVCLVSGSAADSRYATLSYCWGLVNPYVLTLDNHDAFHERIRWSELPKTMRDAMVICRRLSVRYLWIDALCIIQGPDGDFQQEASRMQAVYSGSIFTIAAADSSDSHGGCFKERHPLRHTDCRIHEDDEQLLYLRVYPVCQGHYTPGGRGKSGGQSARKFDNGNTPGYCVLDSRGWVFQERILSPRTLYFGRDDIHFECREGLVCQANPSFEKSHTLNDSRLKDLYLKLVEVCDETSEVEFLDVWHQILSLYSQTVLSYQADRLSAIAGVVSVPQNSLRIEASFGLWLEYFLDELCWYVNYSVRPQACTVSEFDFLPTWSWMHLVDFQFANLAELYKPYDTLYTAEVVEYPEPTPFIQVPKLAAHLRTVRFKGPIVRCRAVMRKDRGEPVWALLPLSNTVEGEFSEIRSMGTSDALNSTPLDDAVEQTFLADSAEEECSETESIGPWEAPDPNHIPFNVGQKQTFFPDEPSALSVGKIMYCMLLKRETQDGEFRELHVWDCCLVLTPMQDGNHDIYTRTGVYCEDSGALDRQWDRSDEGIAQLASRMRMFPSIGHEKETLQLQQRRQQQQQQQQQQQPVAARRPVGAALVLVPWE
ncbi:hypothetical protein DL768_000207 [Monosporascus sp. mg162]|nr:hypothetical protein DL768_000207 [Monosporascus sp. mg162]